MPAPHLSRELHAFCYEHHTKMSLNQSLSNSKDGTAESPTYACREPACLVHYNVLRGYFESRQGNTYDLDVSPNVRCAHDSTPMYLAELNPAKRSFRLWICPHCDGRHTNEAGLVGLERDENQNGPDEGRMLS